MLITREEVYGGLPECPCKGCEDRHIKCHSDCEKYKRYDAENEEIRRKRVLYLDAYDYREKQYQKIKRQFGWEANK